MDAIKKAINKYTVNEFGHKADFKHPESIGLAYTTLTDYEIPIQVSIDITNMILTTYIGSDFPTDTHVVERLNVCADDIEMILDFDELISGWSGYIEEHIDNYI